MGAWGYKQVQSDEGSDVIFPALEDAARQPNGILDVDEGFKGQIKWIADNKLNKSLAEWYATDTCLSYAELIYAFRSNTQDELIARAFEIAASWERLRLDGVKYVVVSEKTLQTLLGQAVKYRKDKLKEFKTSGWVKEDIYAKRCKWVDTLIDAMKSLISDARAGKFRVCDQATGKFIIWDRSKTPFTFLGYSKAIQLTDDHDLNRLRLFLVNQLGGKRRTPHPAKLAFGWVVKPYWSVETYAGRQGKYYKLIFHNEFDEQQTVVKSKTADGLMQEFYNQTNIKTAEYEQQVEAVGEPNPYERRDIWYMPGRRSSGLSSSDIWAWENLYNRAQYMMYIKSLKAKK